MVARFLSHHSFSDEACACSSATRCCRSWFWAISEALWKMVWPQPGEKALAWIVRVSTFPLTAGSAYLLNDVAQLGLNLLLGALEALPQVVADGALLQQRLQGLLCVAHLDEAVDVLDGAAHQGRLEHAVGDLGLALGRLHVEE